ncbi:MAG: apolipoprotein N-acyltransferase [Deltaproteobacteria bacterium]|nr:apolipoprotein N-acyltransferase [Deltaproteobacteria bacterium]
MPAAAEVGHGFGARADTDPLRGADALATAAGGALYFLGYLGWGAWPCLFLFLVPLWWALARAARRRQAAGLGFLFGACAFAGGHLWLLALIGPFLDGRWTTGAALWLAYGAWFALAFALYGLAFHALRRRGYGVGVAGVAPYVLLEWAQPQIFPLYAGNGLVAVPLLAQAADLGGPLLLTGLLAGANLVVFESIAWLDGRRARPAATWIAGAVVGLAVVAYGLARMAEADAASAHAPAVRVGIVQANLDVRAKDTLGVITHRKHLAQTRELLNEGDVDLVVWPESAYVRGIRRPLPVSSRPIVQDLPIPLLFGASSATEVDGRKVKSNSALLAGEDGFIRDAYDKNLLIPLAESMPFATTLPALAALFPHAEQFAAAETVPALRLGPWRIATPICYEAIRPELVRRMVRESSPHILVTLANDAWFGDSQEPWIHLGLARLRAIEHRRWLVRATNSGVSAIVDPAGRLVARTGLLTRANLRGIVHPLAGATLYARLGDWPGWIALAVAAAATLAGRRR